MAPRELILGISKGRLDKLKGGSYGQHTIPVKLRGGGVIIGGMLSVAGSSQHGGMLGAAGATTGAGADWMKVAKKIAGVASPLSLIGGPEMAPLAGALAAYSGSGKNKKRKGTARKARKTAGVAGEIAKSLLDTQGYNKEGEAIAQVGRVVAGSEKKWPKRSETPLVTCLKSQRYTDKRAGTCRPSRRRLRKQSGRSSKAAAAPRT